MAYGWKSGFLWKFRGGRRTMPGIPEEICYEILSRLPVHSLLACKSVCKDWYALISTSAFVKNHHNLAIQKNNPNLMLNDFASDQFYSIGYDSLPSSSSSSSSSVCEIKDYAIEMYHPYKYKFSRIHYCAGFLGSSNGLICMWLHSLLGDKSLICLWNPATREYKDLPKSSIGFNRRNVCVHGLGYDRDSDDYKLAIGVEAPGSKDSTLVQIYTLASNLWEKEKIIPYRFCYLKTSGVFVNGNLHWLALGRCNNFLLLSLDISAENFKELQLPREVQEMNKKDPCLGVSQGCLCLLVSSDFNGILINFEVWEMLDYGIPESWTKRYIIAHESIISDRKYFRLVRSFEKDKILLLGGDTLVLYDSKHGSVRELKIDHTPFRNAETYFESLVSLNSGTYMVRKRKRTTEETIVRRRNPKNLWVFD